MLCDFDVAVGGCGAGVVGRLPAWGPGSHVPSHGGSFSFFFRRLLGPKPSVLKKVTFFYEKITPRFPIIPPLFIYFFFVSIAALVSCCRSHISSTIFGCALMREQRARGLSSRLRFLQLVKTFSYFHNHQILLDEERGFFTLVGRFDYSRWRL